MTCKSCLTRINYKLTNKKIIIIKNRNWLPKKKKKNLNQAANQNKIQKRKTKKYIGEREIEEILSQRRAWLWSSKGMEEGMRMLGGVVSALTTYLYVYINEKTDSIDGIDNWMLWQNNLEKK